MTGPNRPFRLPWSGDKSSEAQAAREEARRRRLETEQLAQQRRADELRRQQSDLDSLARGGLPIQAVERLREIGESEGAIFTSDLTPEEAGLLRREGFRALGLVTGSAMYHVGQAYASAYGDCEVRVLSDAYDAAMALAVGRMAQELHHIRAHGVVGVRLALVRHEWADGTVEVQVVGTAVEGPGSPPAEPWMCDLSGQEWYALRRAGYEPRALVWGHSSWFLLTTWDDEQTVYTWQNAEMGHWSAGLYQARNHAMDSVRRQARQHSAAGVAGVQVTRRLDEVRLTGGEGGVYEREHHNLVVSVVGTAIAPIPHAARQIRATRTVLSLREGRLSPVAIEQADATIE